MLGLMRRVLRVLRREGVKGFVKRALVWVDYRTGLVSFLLLPYIEFVLRRVQSVPALLDLLFSESIIGVLFRPQQVREEIEALLNLLERFKPRYVLEIGTAQGGTLLLFTRIAARDALLISIDLPGGPFGGGYPRLRGLVYKRFARKGQKIVLLRADSHDPRTLEKVKELLKGEKLDFLFIDGDHSYEGVRKDYEMYSALVRDGGIIAFHDIVEHPPETGCEVSKFWNELKREAGRMNNVKIVELVKDWGQGWAGIGVVMLKRRS